MIKSEVTGFSVYDEFAEVKMRHALGTHSVKIPFSAKGWLDFKGKSFNVPLDDRETLRIFEEGKFSFHRAVIRRIRNRRVITFMVLNENEYDLSYDVGIIMLCKHPEIYGKTLEIFITDEILGLVPCCTRCFETHTVKAWST